MPTPIYFLVAVFHEKPESISREHVVSAVGAIGGVTGADARELKGGQFLLPVLDCVRWIADKKVSA